MIAPSPPQAGTAQSVFLPPKEIEAKGTFSLCLFGAVIFCCKEETIHMETRVAVIGVIVEDPDSAERLNAILHESARYILGRMGIPYREKGINIISIAVDAPQDAISGLSGKIGALPGVSVKTAYSNVITKKE